MKKTKLDKNILLGGIVLEDEKYQVVHMNLKKGNETDDYQNDRKIIIFNISGKISVSANEKVEILNDFEMLEIEKDNMHIIRCIEDAQIIIFKI